MSERIEELARQATDFVSHIPCVIDREQSKTIYTIKLAELIVKECAEIGQQSVTRGIGMAISEGTSMEVTRQALPDYVKRKIKEHFGVEEQR